MNWKAVGTAAMALAVALPAGAQTVAGSAADWEFLVGRWSGRAIFFRPREPARGPAFEDVTATCARVLKDQFVRCDTRWVRTDTGAAREIAIHFRWDAASKTHEILHLYDGPWAPGRETYVYDAGRRAFVAFADTEEGGAIGVERIEWRLSADRATLTGTEMSQLSSEAAGGWLKTFEFTWRRQP
jgi:hypothetical protein